jgi:hypothetical protein
MDLMKLSESLYVKRVDRNDRKKAIFTFDCFYSALEIAETTNSIASETCQDRK